MKIDFKLIITLGPKELNSINLGVSDIHTIGSSEEAEIKLIGDRISPTHAIVSFDDEASQWNIIAKDGEVRVRGKLIQHEALSIGQSISIGPYLLRLELIKETTIDEYALSDDSISSIQSDKPSFSKRILSSARTHMPSAFRQAIQTKRNRVLILVVATIVIVLPFLGSSEKPLSKDSANHVYTIEQQREIDRYNTWVNELWKENDLETAISVASSAYINNQSIEEFSSLYIAAIQRQVLTLAEQGDFERALKVIETANTELQDNATLVSLQDRLNTDIQQKKDHLAQFQQSEEKFIHLLDQSNAAFDAGDIEQAMHIIESMDPLLTKFEPGWREQKSELIGRIDQAILEKDKLFQQQREQRIARMDLVNEHFVDCMTSYNKGDKTLAYVSCRRAVELADGEAVESEINLWLNLLGENYSDELLALKSKAQDCYSKKWISCAFHHWEKILKLEPENEEIASTFALARSAQLEIAKVKFREARAYVDIGRPERAEATLKELKLLYPISNSEIYKKADEMFSQLVRLRG